MIRRLSVTCAAVAAGLWLAGLGAGTASASGPGPAQQAGCSGFSCWAQLNVITSGSSPGGSTGSSGKPAPPPPECWYGPPTYTPAQMYDLLQNYKTGTPGAGPTVYKKLDPKKITKEYKSKAKGLWYSADPNPDNPAAGQACVANMPSSFIWVPAGQQPPQPGIGPGNLAQYAYSMLTVPQPDVRLNPSAESIVNLPTFVKVTDPPGVRNRQLHKTATIGTESVTVAVTEKSVQISSPPGTPDTVYDSGCGPTGSKESASAMNAAGKGQKPDCGVVFRQASSNSPFTISVSQEWTATAYPGPYVPGKTGNLLPAGDGGPMHSPPSTVQVPVKELQGLTNG